MLRAFTTAALQLPDAADVATPDASDVSAVHVHHTNNKCKTKTAFFDQIPAAIRYGDHKTAFFDQIPAAIRYGDRQAGGSSDMGQAFLKGNGFPSFL